MNFETLMDADPNQAQQMLVPALAVLDRVEHEWHSWNALLEEDNTDIRETLDRIGVTTAGPPSATDAFTSRQSLSVTHALETENRALKEALDDAIVQFDLPASATSSEATRAADEQVLALLRRMLYREDQVTVNPPRAAPTSGNPANAGVPLDQIETILHRFLSAQLPSATDISVHDLQPLAGGASREAWIFDLTWSSNVGPQQEACILMREPVASVLVSDSSASEINGTRRTIETEIHVIRAMEDAGLPVPTVLWSDATGEWFERPFSIARRLPGTADASQISSSHAPQLLDQFIHTLTKIHQLEPNELNLEVLGTPTPESAALEQVAQFEHNFNQQRLEAFPAITYTIRWLKKNAPTADRVCVVHGDYRLGNFLFEDADIIAILDWEQVHLGDVAEEIAFMYWRLWSLEALCPIEEFVRRYEAVASTQIPPDRLAYYRVFIEFKMLVVLLTGLKSFFATPEYQLHYGSPQTGEMIRDAQLRAIEALYEGGPTVAFDAYTKVV